MMAEKERLEVGCKVILTHLTHGLQITRAKCPRYLRGQTYLVHKLNKVQLTPPSKNQSQSDTGFVPPTVAEIAAEKPLPKRQ